MTGGESWPNASCGPLFDYLGERIGEESSILYALERYVRLVE